MRTIKGCISCLITTLTFLGLHYEKEVKTSLNRSKFSTNNLSFDPNLEKNKELENNSIAKYNIKGKEGTNSTKNSFIQSLNSTSTEEKDLGGYNNFVIKINEAFFEAKRAYITANSYRYSRSYITKYSNEFYAASMKHIWAFLNCEEDNIRFYKNTKKDMREQFYNLLSLKEDDKKNDLYKTELPKFKSKIESHLRTIDWNRKRCKGNDNNAYREVDYYLLREFCSIWGCINKIVSFTKGYAYNTNIAYSDAMDRAMHGVSQYKLSDKNFSEIRDFLNSDRVQIIMKENICKKELKNSLKLLIEEISDMNDTYVKDVNTEHNFFSSYKNDCKNAMSINITKNNITYIFTTALQHNGGYQQYNIWNNQLKSNFYEIQKKFKDLLKNALKGLGEEINSLVYPENVIMEVKKIFTEGNDAYHRTKSLIEENFRLENLSHKYKNKRISDITSELTELYARALAHNINLKDKFNSFNTKYKSIESNINSVELAKRELLLEESKLTDITYDILAKKKDIEDIIGSANNELALLKSDYDELMTLVSEIQSS
ncbi:reticulocyte binding protein, putative, partial [Plasmodium relictum]